MLCRNCKLFIADQTENGKIDQTGECRRYPKPIQTTKGYWCAEWVAAKT